MPQEPKIGATKANLFETATSAEKRALIDQRLRMQTFEVGWYPQDVTYEDAEARVTSALALVQGIKPKDDIKAMLATQMVGRHDRYVFVIRSRLGAPDRRPQKMPFRTRRSFTRGAPRGLFGRKGLIAAHSKSVSS